MSSPSETEGILLLNRILEARWGLECASDDGKADALAILNRMLDEAIAGRPELSRGDLMQALLDPWREYCRKRRKFG